MRLINALVIHGADTYPNMDVGVDEIRRWHITRGWSDIGYHFVILRDGSTIRGRPIDQAGAHAKGYNANSVGICLVGGKAHKGNLPVNYTAAQWSSLLLLVGTLVEDYPIENIFGHNELTKSKTCPGFEVRGWNDFFLNEGKRHGTMVNCKLV